MQPIETPFNRDPPTTQANSTFFTQVPLAHPLSHTPKPVVQPTLMPLVERQKMFDEVWDIVHEHYLYPDFHGEDWNAIRSVFAPEVVTVSSNDEFYLLLSDMVEQLGDQHSRFLAPGNVLEEQEKGINIDSRVGIGIVTKSMTDSTMIENILPGSPAEQAGLLPHDRIIAIDGVLCRVTTCNDLQGAVNSQIRLTVVRVDGHAYDIIVKRQHMHTHVTPIIERMDGDIGYISIPSLWLSDMDMQVNGALTDLVVEKPLRGLIVDLRGNPGGWRDVLISVLSHFVRGNVGVFFDRQKETPMIVNEGSGPDLRHVPLVVVVDHITASYAEVMAAILQAEAGAKVVGVPTAGNTETIYAYELSGGARLWLAQEGFRLRNGINLEGTGIYPDVLIDESKRGSSDDEDPYIIEAIRLLHE